MSREICISARYHIWSGEYDLYWRPQAAGYTSSITEAGMWPIDDARRIASGCGPEKKIQIIEAKPFPVTDDHRDAPDGAILGGYARVGDYWEVRGYHVEGVHRLSNDLPSLFAGAPKGAILSGDRRYRYFLWRIVDPLNRPVNFIGLNPSTAAEFKDDQTIRRCMNYAKSWGYGAVYMTNLYGFRSTDPKGLLSVDDPVGPENDRWLYTIADQSAMVVLCWGKPGGARGKLVMENLYERACHLGLNLDGSPKHPVRLRADLRPTPFREF